MEENLLNQKLWLGETEVTQAQFEKITGTNPSKTKGPNLPAQVNWTQATKFCELMNRNFHLLTDLHGAYQPKLNGNMLLVQVHPVRFTIRTQLNSRRMKKSMKND